MTPNVASSSSTVADAAAAARKDEEEEVEAILVDVVTYSNFTMKL